MTDQQKKSLALFGLFALVVYLVTRPKTAVRYHQQNGTMTSQQLADSYKEMVSSPLRVFINPLDETRPDTGTPWAVDLAKFTRDYAAVKAQYLKYYGGSLSNDLIAWFSPSELSEYVEALWNSNQQAMS